MEKQIAPAGGGSDPEQVRSIGWVQDEPIVVTQIEAKMPAAKAGMQLGDQIVAINGVPMRSLFSVIQFLQKNGDKPVEISALRNGQEMNFTATPVMTRRQRPEALPPGLPVGADARR